MPTSVQTTTTTASAESGPAVRATGLVKEFGGVRAVDGVDIEIERGEGRSTFAGDDQFALRVGWLIV